MRRVAIAGILAMEPDILVLDEPTVGLDPAGQEEMMKLFTSLHETYHKTLIIVTHDMNIVADYAKRVLVMKAGRLVFDGTPLALFTNESMLKDFQLGRPDMMNVLASIASLLGHTNSIQALTLDEVVSFLMENS
jgi:energy-coupling factor transport system ATP-binding protein